MLDDTESHQLMSALAPVPALPAEVAGGLPTFPLKPHEVVLTGSLRKMPYAVRGRQQETGHAVARLQSMPNPILLITGTPGCGKTAVLTNIEHYARAYGTVTIQLRLHDFHSDEKLAAALLGDRITMDIQTGTSESTSANVGIWTGLFRAGGSKSKSEHRAAILGTPWYQALLTMAAAHPEHGVLYTWDEVQNIRGDAETVTADARTRIHNFIVTMHTHMLTESTEQGTPPKVMLVAAGLLNAQYEMERVMISRFDRKDVMRIGPLSTRAGYQIIHDHMTAALPNGGRLARLPESIIERILAACGGNAQHLAAAGEIAQQSGAKSAAGGLDTVPEDSWEVIRTGIEKTRGSLYSDRVGRNTTHPRRIAATAAALAMNTWGPQLPQAGTESLVKQISEECNHQGEDLMAEIIRKGVLELRQVHDFFPSIEPVAGSRTETHYCFPIHIMRSWLQRTHESDRSAAVAVGTRRIEELIRGNFGRPTEREGTIDPWEWDYDGPYPSDSLKSISNVTVLPTDDAVANPWHHLTNAPELLRRIPTLAEDDQTTPTGSWVRNLGQLIRNLFAGRRDEG